MRCIYNSAGRLAYVDDSWIGASNRTAYAYADKVNRRQLTYPSGSFLTFALDALNRLRRAVGAGKDFSYEYDPLERRRLKQDNLQPVNSVKFVSDGAEELEEFEERDT